MIHDAGTLASRPSSSAPDLPSGMFTAFRLAIDIFHKTEMDGGPGDKDRFRQRMVERVLTQFQAIPRADLEYLLDKLDAIDHARETGVVAA